MTRRIELHIEELVLHGFRPADRHRIALALQGELTRLLGDGDTRGLVSGDRAQIDAGTVQVAGPANAAEIGRQVAASIHGGLNR